MQFPSNKNHFERFTSPLFPFEKHTTYWMQVSIPQIYPELERDGDTQVPENTTFIVDMMMNNKLVHLKIYKSPF